jgi:xylulokinase
MEADISGKRVVPVDQEEGPAFGAALLAAVGAGAFPDVGTAAVATLRRAGATQPREGAHDAYAEPYRRYQRLYAALRAARDSGRALA